MSRHRPLPVEEPDKPLCEMTAAERAAFITRLRRTLRDNGIRQGKRRPRSMREFGIWREAITSSSMEGLAAMSDVTPETIAQWMVSRLKEQGGLYQADAVGGIAETFGDEFTYLNDNGNPAIDKRVLRAFRKITGDTVVWDRWEFYWRMREEDDEPGRKQE